MLGNKILELRKKNGFSQEELAEKLEVTRQTISKWELGETSPDIVQAQKLSKIFKVSLDELVDNDIKDILAERISNTERLAGLTIKILKTFGIIALVAFIIFGIYKLFYVSTYAWFMGVNENLNCTLDGKNYSYRVTYGKEENTDKSNMMSSIDYKILTIERQKDSAYLGGIIDISKYEYYYQFEEAVYGYFEVNGGKCE